MWDAAAESKPTCRDAPTRPAVTICLPISFRLRVSCGMPRVASGLTLARVHSRPARGSPMKSQSGQHEFTLASAHSSKLLLAIMAFSVFTNLLMLTGPLFMLQVYDRVLGSRSEETLVALLILVSALYFFYWILEFSRGRVMARIGVRLQASMGQRIFAAFIERAALRRGRGPGDGALQDLDAVRSLFSSPALLAIFDMPWTPFFLFAIFLFHPSLGWLALAGAFILLTVTLLNRVLTRKSLEGAQGLSTQAQRLARQAEESAALVWSQGMTRAMTDRWQRLMGRAGQESLVANDKTGTFTSFTKAFRLYLQSAMLALGAWLVLKHEMTAGAMIAGSILLGRALAPVEQVLGQWAMIQRARSGWKTLNAFLEMIPTRNAPIELPEPDARLVISNVGLRGAPGSPPILQGISFHINPGEVLGVIGNSGAGKSSLASVIQGLCPASTGDVRLGGATLDQYGAERLGRLIGCLPQDVRFFDGTVAENIAHMAQQPDTTRVIKAAQLARAHEIVLKLPKGYDTLLQEGDRLLSGGQRQRLALARALYHDPVLLVLDEPNSALDAAGSEALNNVVADMKAAGKSVLIMTHRPSAIAVCDNLLVLDQGSQKAFGPRDKMVQPPGRNSYEPKKPILPKQETLPEGAAA
ncbi:ATP-binding cassette subfamily C protein [Rhodovulum steppense]|uniref:ATP-binding cassette subfamily C protein n=2 Tax=Rhodovulum steppense TaxID=540251 RepID=A0A4R1YN31_9RHOB|nr:ATP-binding cassette subfamily C protein [Rhodovulum steppense]